MNLNFDCAGTGVAIVTPFNKSLEVDYASVTKLLEHIINGKANYIVLLGTTGESVTLSLHEKKELIYFVVKTVNNRLPIVLGVGGNNTQEIVTYLKEQDLSAFSAILSVTPYYNKPTQQGLFEHYKAVCAASPIPVILYNVPGRTGVNMTWQTTVKIANECSNAIAIKEASGNIEQCSKIIKHAPKHFKLISGDDSITLPLIACGAVGVISVIANIYTKEFSTLVNHALIGNYTEARSIHLSMVDLIDLLFVEGNPGGVKAFLHHKNITQPFVRLPLMMPSEGVVKEIQKQAI